MDFYFDKFEHREPPAPLTYNPKLELIWQCFITINLVIGAWYISWRWLNSLNFDALWFAIPLVLAETLAYIGLVFFSVNLWKVKDVPTSYPPKTINACLSEPLSQDRPIRIDLFFPTYDEDVDLVRLSIIDALKITYPHEIQQEIHILDDGKRTEMASLAAELNVNYITRESNIGFKAGNLRNAMEQTDGDFIVICDADTRPFKTIIENTLGYFTDPNVAWVQTPQWFFDIPEGETLTQWTQRNLGSIASIVASKIESLLGKIKIGEDPFVNNSQMFYDIIQRRRNWANASFCCGAGSIHRREAVMQSALKAYAENIEKQRKKQSNNIKKLTGEIEIDNEISELLDREILLNTEFTPYIFHVSEDIYTSIMLHSDEDREWRSVLHPKVESKMLSPQDLQSWTVQRFKYAGGTIDITLHDNPVFRKGMRWPQKLLYSATVWGYFGAIWNLLFLIAPIIYLMTGIAPVSSYSQEFYWHIIPFIITNELATMFATWGIAGFKGKSNYLAFFPINLKAIWTVIKGEEIKFPTTPKNRQEGNYINLVTPQLLIITLTIMSLIIGWFNYHHHWYGDLDLSGLLINTFWCINNIIAMSSIIFAAFWKPIAESKFKEDYEFDNKQPSI
ncbi:MAG: glycosyltransferase [Ferrimonas sp.]